ncbi:DUF5107 domain-containing protein [Curtobacterium sp. MCSS17_011]|uniref:DUF5107 domain-containing protein n=1 Tax=Curtobacterium sp. MCSS17_011 TaxID=2175643 RepID=UPI0021AD2E5A|nr:DUF5107 domain-containing protein [Curtobacterium sp. MCSS17_011]
MGTYEIGEPMEYPAYLSRRVYQGSTGAVYPLPFHEQVGDERVEREWDAIHLENEFVRLMILPELGGRIHLGYDKTADHDFFYRNDVIKPALVGLTGPWLAGGVEFNWPQHHRPATYLPTSWEIEEESDGAVTVWCSDHDPFNRMQGTHGVRLRPGSSLIELRVRLTNRSETTQTFLWWANVAARVNDDYQSFFPTDVAKVADHAKRAVVDFPAVHGTYYGVDYAERAAEGARPAATETWDTADAVDGVALPPRDDAPDRIDWYHNIPVPTSYMVTGTTDDFFGGYDHGRRAGFVHWADHTIAPGKKQWTWGNSPFGHAWDRNLTDGEDGAYVELMAGVFTDNQPDFSFLAPGETKAFSQYWYPITEIGPAHQANRDVAVRLDVAVPSNGTTTVRVAVASTRALENARVILTDAEGNILAERSAQLAPGVPYVERFAVGGEHQADSLVLRVEADGAELLSWSAGRDVVPQEPLEPATEPPAPDAIDSVDELVVTALHLTQYRHATRSPEPYLKEALRRDPHDARAQTLQGVRAYRAGRFEDAEAHFRAAHERQTRRNPNPPDGTATHMLALTLRRLGRPDEAIEFFGRAAWVIAWARAAAVERARTLAARGTAADDAHALELMLPLIDKEPGDQQATAIAVTLLRRAGRGDEAQVLLRKGREVNVLDAWLRWLDTSDGGTDAQILLDLAHENRAIGAEDAAFELLRLADIADQSRAIGAPSVRPLTDIVRAAVLFDANRDADADTALASAATVDGRWCFPGRLDDVEALNRVLSRRPDNAHAAALLGHWLYANERREEAITAWQTAVDGNPGDAVSWRNLGLALFDVRGDVTGAKAAYERAATLRPDDARLLFERDQLDQRTGAPVQERIDRLRGAARLVATRDDLTVQLADLLTMTGEQHDALQLIGTREFHPWEGGEGAVIGAWTRACLAAARSALRDGAAEQALEHVRRTLDTPRSLGEARHPLANTAEIYLLLGDVLAQLGQQGDAEAAWRTAADQDGDFVEMSVATYSDQTVWSILALRRLGEDVAAEALRDRLAAGLAEAQRTPASVDYFATSLPSLLLFDEDVAVRRRRDDLLVSAQLELIDGNTSGARKTLARLLDEDPSHVAATVLSTRINETEEVTR